jgi:Transposase DDE domain
VAGHARPRSAPTWPGGLATATAPATLASSGGCGFTWLRPPAGLPIAFALSNPKIDEREVAIDLFDSDQALLARRDGQTLIADKGYASTEFETRLAERGVELVRPARRNEPRRRGATQLRSLRQIIESINATLKTQLSLERHGGHSPQGVLVRVLQRLLALTAAIWHNHHAGHHTLRSLTAYDH